MSRQDVASVNKRLLSMCAEISSARELRDHAGQCPGEFGRAERERGRGLERPLLALLVARAANARVDGVESKGGGGGVREERAAWSREARTWKRGGRAIVEVYTTNSV